MYFDIILIAVIRKEIEKSWEFQMNVVKGKMHLSYIEITIWFFTFITKEIQKSWEFQMNVLFKSCSFKLIKKEIEKSWEFQMNVVKGKMHEGFK
uniref:Uncharacterized protein n=1 Tax=Lactuca sativa TaxID=4236 RepID=A0A9R1WMR1_LACSA|nr:hypothetical protein LSAT_V11C100043290 [Lactuca sativa]